MKNLILRLIPYAASIIIGFCLFVWGMWLENNDWKGLLINISSAFLAIPLLYLFYELVRDASRKKLNKELLDYAKMQVDKEVLSVLNHLSKIIYKYEEKDFSFAGISRLLSLTVNEVNSRIGENNYIGFQILKSWELNEDAFRNILKNPFILGRLDDDQVSSLITLLKGLQSYDLVFRKPDAIFEKTGKRATGYRVVRGDELNRDNSKYKDRFLLLKDLGSNKHQVEDFGDFPKYNQNQLLDIFVVEKNAIDYLATTIAATLSNISTWVDLTGGEFIIDPKMFRLGAQSVPNEHGNNVNEESK